MDVGYGHLLGGGLLALGGLLQQSLEAGLSGLDDVHGIDPKGGSFGADGVFFALSEGLTGVDFIFEPGVNEVLVGVKIIGVPSRQCGRHHKCEDKQRFHEIGIITIQGKIRPDVIILE